jgi:hypothetical protein
LQNSFFVSYPPGEGDRVWRSSCCLFNALSPDGGEGQGEGELIINHAPVKKYLSEFMDSRIWFTRSPLFLTVNQKQETKTARGPFFCQNLKPETWNLSKKPGISCRVTRSGFAGFFHSHLPFFDKVSIFPGSRRLAQILPSFVAERQLQG